MTTPLSHRTAIIAVHGVQPHPRYEIQDICAKNLAAQLNNDKRFGFADWTVDVVQPQGNPDTPPLPTISRVHVKDDVDGTHPFFDVVEAYWSPLDKGLTNIGGVLTWLLRSLFVPLNTTAKYAASTGKTLYDFGFLVTGVLIAAALLVVGLFSFLGTANQILFEQCTSAPKCTFDTPLDIWTSWSTHLTGPTLGILAVTTAGAYLILQSLLAGFRWLSQLMQPAPQRRQRIWLIGAVLLVGLLLVSLAIRSSIAGTTLGWSAVAFVVAGGFFLGGRAILTSFVVNFFSDVQIYTTRDENNKFFQARSNILNTVSAVLEHMCSPEACHGNPYDRVFVFGHSLGSTISMDAIIQFYQSCEQHERSWDDFKRLRGFVTFGTALEKTKYFFDLQNPSLSASYEQWRNDAYGVLFTPNVADLDKPRRSLNTGIFWSNHWYFLDVVSNPIRSYRSFLIPGESVRDAGTIRQQVATSVPLGKTYIPRLVCHDVPLWHFFSFPSVIPHGDYFGDPHFWRTGTGLHVLDVVAREATAKAPVAAPPPKAPPPAKPPLEGQPSAEPPPEGAPAPAILEALKLSETVLGERSPAAERSELHQFDVPPDQHFVESISQAASGKLRAPSERKESRTRIDVKSRVEEVPYATRDRYVDKYSGTKQP